MSVGQDPERNNSLWLSDLDHNNVDNHTISKPIVSEQWVN